LIKTDNLIQKCKKCSNQMKPMTAYPNVHYCPKCSEDDDKET